MAAPDFVAAGRPDTAWFDATGERPQVRFGAPTVRSVYITMRDGVRIAADVWLPGGRGSRQRLPTILRQTRYMRSVQLRQPLRGITGGQPFDHTGQYRRRRARFLAQGYAWVDVDVRGSGASFGAWIAPWGPDEILDGRDIVDWIIAQPWSNGVVGATGISYDGSCAEMLLVHRHPAVRAVAPRFASFEPYTDIAYPGGVFHQHFIRAWHDAGRALDRNAPWEIAGQLVRAAITGVTPVNGRKGRRMLREAIRGHAENCSVYDLVARMPCRDSVLADHPFYQAPDWSQRLAGQPRTTEGTYALLGAYNYLDDLNASGAAVYAYSGWFDLGYNHAAIKRYRSIDNARLLLGPWNHGGGSCCDPRIGSIGSGFDHDAELQRFFDFHLKGRDTGLGGEPPVHYFTMVENRWKSAPDWPPPATAQQLYLGAERCLTPALPGRQEGSDAYTPDYTTGTGRWSRWQGGTEPNRKVRYFERSAQDARMLAYTGAPLPEDLEVTGHPLVTLFVASSAADGHFFAYLEDVDPRGDSTYVTEGMLRAQHRRLSQAQPPYPHLVPYRTMSERELAPLVPGEVAELTFDLLPTSYLFRRGHRIRLALAGADRDAFALLPATPPDWQVMRCAAHPSHLVLPVVTR